MSTSIQDVFDQLVAVNGHLTDLHNDLVAVAGATNAVRQSVDTVDTTLGTGFTVLSQDIAVLAGLEAQSITVLNHLSRQQDTVICALEQIARTTCALLNEAHEQTGLQHLTADASAALRTMNETTHPDAALGLARQRDLVEQVERCCPPPTEPPPCRYEPCPAPDQIELTQPRPDVPQFPKRDDRPPIN